MKKTTMMTLIVSAMLAVTCTGCSGSLAEIAERIESAGITDSAEAAEETPASVPGEAAEASDNTPAVIQTAVSADIVGILNTADLFTERDQLQSADISDAQNITVSDGDSVTITEAGVYVLSGTASNCSVIVEADSKDKVQLVLNGVSITNTDSPAIYVKSADKVFLTTTDTRNTLTVTGSFTADGETNTDAVIFSKDDLTLNGTGTLEIVSPSGNGVSSKDSLKITGGTYLMQTGNHAFEANDLIAVSGGSFTIEAEKDGFHCEKDAEGNIYIADGSFSITSGSDGVQATAYLQIDGGTFEISAAEGLESSYIQINGGEISINASDDGINAPAGGNTAEVAVEVNGGVLTIVVAQGDTDGIDANGSIYVNGGRIDITAPFVSFDYDRDAEFNGGTIIINGEEVSEIPEEMMGGFGGRGGFGGFGRKGNSDGQNGSGRPERPDGFGGFDDSDLPEDFGDWSDFGDWGDFGEWGNFGDWDDSDMPEGFGGQDGSGMPELPDDFGSQGGSGRRGGFGKRGGRGQDGASQNQDGQSGRFDDAMFDSETALNGAV